MELSFMYFILYFNNSFLELDQLYPISKEENFKTRRKGKVVHFLVSKTDTELVLIHSDLG